MIISKKDHFREVYATSTEEAYFGRVGVFLDDARGELRTKDPRTGSATFHFSNSTKSLDDLRGLISTLQEWVLSHETVKSYVTCNGAAAIDGRCSVCGQHVESTSGQHFVTMNAENR